MKPQSSRRALLGALASLPAAVTLTSTGTAAPGLPGAAEPVAALWREWLLAKAQSCAASLAYEAAYDLLPWWAKNGPSHVNSEAKQCGYLSGWPAIQDYSVPEGRIQHLIRPDEATYRTLYRHESAIWGEDRARPRFDDRMTRLSERVALQKEEEVRAGLPEADKATDEASDRLCDCEDLILQLDATSPAVLAARIIIEVARECPPDSTPEGSVALGIAALALKGLLPSLTGELAADAAEIANNPTREISDMRISRGIEGPKP